MTGIRVKDFNVLSALMIAGYHPSLIRILDRVCRQYPDHVVITSAFREGDPGVHGTVPCRAVDLRSWVFPHPEAVAAWINLQFRYDYRRPGKSCCIYHDVGNGAHLHLQVHPNTVSGGIS